MLSPFLFSNKDNFSDFVFVGMPQKKVQNLLYKNKILLIEYLAPSRKGDKKCSSPEKIAIHLRATFLTTCICST